MKAKGGFGKDIVLSVVAPVYNEEEGITDFIGQTRDVLRGMGVNYEIILVNDGSRDNSLGVMGKAAQKDNNIRVIDLSRNYGREIAMTAGLDHAIGDYVVLMDSDLQDSPSLIPTLLTKMLDGGFDVVYAARSSREGESFMKKLTSKLFYRVAKNFTGLDIPENAGDYRIFSRRVVNAITSMKEHNRYLKMLYGYVGFKVSSVEFQRQARTTGTTSYNWVKLVNAAMDAIFSFSQKPLRLISLTSMLLSFSLLLYSVYVFVSKILGASVVEGWTSLMLMLSFMFSILFIFLATISEYISRILVETKNRPLYYVRDEIGGTSFQAPKMVQED